MTIFSKEVLLDRIGQCLLSFGICIDSLMQSKPGTPQQSRYSKQLVGLIGNIFDLEEMAESAPNEV